MKAAEVLSLLKVTRQTLTAYVRAGYIKVIKNAIGRYDYDGDSVYKFLNKGQVRKTYLYARVSTPKQKKDLQNQIDLLKSYCYSNGISINGIYSDVASGISFEKRIEFFKMLDDVISGKVEFVIISYKIET